MTSNRATSVIATAMLMLAASPGRLFGQGANDPLQKPLPELARDIARTISAFGPTNAGAPISLDSAVADGNVVEIRYSVADPAVFARVKANAAMLITGKTSYFCNESRVAYINRGVVIHEVTAVRDGSDKIEIIVDKAACDGLVRPALADAKTLAQIAQSVAKAENGNSGGNDLFRFDGATAHEGNVDKRMVVVDAAALRASFAQITGFVRGYECGKYRQQILQGMAIRYIFVLSDGSPAGDVLIDRSKC